MGCKEMLLFYADVVGTSIRVSELPEVGSTGRVARAVWTQLDFSSMLRLVPSRHIRIVRNTLRRSFCKYFVCIYTTSG